jgi:hypothetical protein
MKNQLPAFTPLQFPSVESNLKRPQYASLKINKKQSNTWTQREIILTIYCEKTRDPQEVLWTMQGDPGPHHPVLSADTIM